MKIYLRSLVEDDAYTSYKWRNNPQVWKYTGKKPDIIITAEIEYNWIKSVLKRNDEKRFAICLIKSNKYIGNIQLTGIQNKTAEYHIFIGDTNYWGKGIGKEATHQIIEYGFKNLRLKKIFLYVNKKNIAAISLYQRCGFKIINETNTQLYMVIEKSNE